jgi:hypothetical protein
MIGRIVVDSVFPAELPHGEAQTALGRDMHPVGQVLVVTSADDLIGVFEDRDVSLELERQVLGPFDIWIQDCHFMVVPD